MEVKHFAATIALEDYIRDYRDADKYIAYCKACNRYNACWSCPPFNFDTEKYLSSCKTASVIGTKITVDADVIRENTGWELCTKATYRMIKEVRPELDRQLLKLETTYPGSRAFFAGTCHICPAEKCSRIKGKPCIAPDRIRPSLESFGFDMVKTAAELLNIEMKWSYNGVLPEYFTLVSGFFSSEKNPEIAFTN
jgi:predicted metal-binding protein